MSRFIARVFWSAVAAFAVSVTFAQQQTVGLFVNDDPQPGLVLFGPNGGMTTYLISNDGLVVNSWTSNFRPALMSYLLDNGNLLRAARLANVDPNFSSGAGRGGRVEEFDWDNNLVWRFDYNSSAYLSHHDIEPLPNGNVLMIAWDWMSEVDAIAAGRDPSTVNGGLWIDSIIEVQPTPPVGGNVVWEWHARDHLIQDFDTTKANFGPVEDHPELVDFNAGGSGTDWTHANGIDYNAELDQIVISVRAMHEIWVIDHSTTTAEAAGHTGGNSGKGGDILYRWGNPQVYRRGSESDRKFYGQHDPQWIPAAYPGAGNILVYNNGQGRPEGAFSSVEEIVTPVDGNGDYPALLGGEAHGPESAIWTYLANPPNSFYSQNISGAERQPNGNTLICEGARGHLFEVEPDGTRTWDYVNPAAGNTIRNQGDVASQNAVFKVRRYPLDFPGFVGKDLTPGDPLEGFTRPFPVPDDSLLLSKAADDGSQIDVSWDPLACTSFDYNLLHGELAQVSTMKLSGAECSLGISGVHSWTGVPGGSLFVLLAGTDDFGVYESSWGQDGAGAERGATKASGLCGTTTKVVSSICP